MQEPATRPALRHAGFAGDLHRALPGHGRGTDRPDLLYPAWHRRAGRHRDPRPSRTWLAAPGSGDWRADRPVVRDPGDDHCATAYLYDHVAGRPAAEGVQP